MDASYYFPHFLYIYNILSFQNLNKPNNNEMVELWKINRWSYTKHKGTKSYTASYNNANGYYLFNGKRYVNYDDLVNDAFMI